MTLDHFVRLRCAAMCAGIMLIAACSGSENDQGPAEAPPLPQFQMRAAMPAGDRQAASVADGADLFSRACGACHLPGGMGTNVLTAQQVAAGNQPEQGLLTNRRDLAAGYVEAVVRNGKGAMPILTRVDVTDSELMAIAGFLEGDRP